jgi:hypothetical protein
MMEVLYGVPLVESFDEAKLLMEGLTTLRPRLVQGLLEKCASVKVKRLFMLLAESCKHSWVRKLDLTNVDFGKGKRASVTETWKGRGPDRGFSGYNLPVYREDQNPERCSDSDGESKVGKVQNATNPEK